MRKGETSTLECIEEANAVTAMHTNFYWMEALGAKITRTHMLTKQTSKYFYFDIFIHGIILKLSASAAYRNSIWGENETVHAFL